MKKKILLSILISFAITISAIPNWYISDTLKEYPNYFIGNGFAQIQNKNIANAEKMAKEEALKDAASTIFCKVSGETINHIEELEKGKESQINKYFLSETKVKTELEIMGYEILKIEKEKQNIYVLVGINKNALLNSFKNKIENSIREISADFNIAEEMSNNNPEQSIKNYEKCIRETRLLEDNLQIYLFLNKWKNEFKEYIGKLPSKQKIERKLTILVGSTPKSTEILAIDLLNVFFTKQSQNSSFIFYPFEYENTGFISKFGNNFSEICSNILISQNNWEKLSYSDYKKADVVLRGKILESDNGMFLTLTMKNNKNNSVKNNQLFVNKATCRNLGWDKIKPENLKQALQKKLALYNAIQTDHRLKIELQTDKMSDGPVVYYFGEEPKIFVRSNKTCFIRLIYIFADETKILLVDNYPIATDQANSWRQIPFDGVICEPSGVEQLIIQASTEKLPTVNYRRVNLGDDTYMDIIESDISSQIAKTRGFKLKNPKKEITEKVVQWTVFEK